jgi:murein DD-endopeptidase MepM/ murein hydrolase activator NlpD
MKIFLSLGCAALLALQAIPAEAQGRKGMRGERPAEADAGDGPGLGAGGVERRNRSISASGLKVAFPPGFACEPIASAFASPTRYDGSMRRDDRNSGLHGGMDLSLKEGTPLLAIAAGEVLTAGAGGRLEGNFLWLRHAPADTGLPFWVFAKYQHLSQLPTLKPGERVAAGQAVALSGNTGTAGGHYGAAGYHHLHLSTFYGPSPDYDVRGMFHSMVSGRDAESDDPLVMYLAGIERLDQVRSLPEERRTVTPAVVDGEGKLHPAGGRTVWPVACARK